MHANKKLYFVLMDWTTWTTDKLWMHTVNLAHVLQHNQKETSPLSISK